MTPSLRFAGLLVGISAALGGPLGYTIGRRTGPAVFERRESGGFSRKSVTRTQPFFDPFGPAAVSFARFVPVVLTFAPVGAGVGHMSPRLFTLFNLAGAAIWSGLVILVGFWLAHLPGVADFVSRYIDFVLIGIVIVSVVAIVVRIFMVRTRSAPAPDVD